MTDAHPPKPLPKPPPNPRWPSPSRSAPLPRPLASTGHTPVKSSTRSERKPTRSPRRSPKTPSTHIYEELGDLLFSVANLARKLNLDPDRALIDATQKFSHRFQHVERFILACAERGDPPPTLAQMEKAWRAAKSLNTP